MAAIGRKGGMFEQLSLAAQSQHFLSGSYIPQLERFNPIAPGYQTLAVRGESHRVRAQEEVLKCRDGFSVAMSQSRT